MKYNLINNIPIEDLYSASDKSLPENVKQAWDSMESYLKEEEIKDTIKESGFDEQGITSVITQGSHADKTGNKVFRVIEKEDIDLICLVGEYTQSISTIIANPEGNKKLSDWTDDINPAFNLIETVAKNGEDYSYSAGGYRSINDFKKLKKAILGRLKDHFQGYTFDMKNKVIKVHIDGSDNGYTLELAIAGTFKLKCSANNVTNYFGSATVKDMIKHKLMSYEGKSKQYLVLNGYDIITNELVPNRDPDYYFELQNFSDFNKYFFKLKDKETGYVFRNYVRFFKNFVKIWNENNERSKVNISSFHIECSLYLLSSSLFSRKVDYNSLKKISSRLKQMACEKDADSEFEKYIEINGVLKMSRNFKANKFREAWSLIDKYLKMNYEKK